MQSFRHYMFLEGYERLLLWGYGRKKVSPITNITRVDTHKVELFLTFESMKAFLIMSAYLWILKYHNDEKSMDAINKTLEKVDKGNIALSLVENIEKQKEKNKLKLLPGRTTDRHAAA